MRDPRAGGLRLEIHRAVLPPGHPFRLTEDEMWCAARRVQVGRAHALVMRPAHHAVHIAIHFAWSHMLRMGAWQAFRDLSALAASGRFDWEDFVSTASRWGATSAGYWTLRLAAALSKLPVPDAVLARLQPRFAGTCGRPLMRHFVNGLVRRDACPSVRLDQALWTIAMQPGSEGHGRIRPWSVSQDLLFALEQRGQLRDRMVESPLVQMGRSGRYLSEIIA
jgi:hypothetical protein